MLLEQVKLNNKGILMQKKTDESYVEDDMERFMSWIYVNSLWTPMQRMSQDR